MPPYPYNYLALQRKSHALTQPELAALVGLKSSSAISRYELGWRKPSLEVALACQVLFGKAPRELFPDIYEMIEEQVMLAGALLMEQLGDAPEGKAALKRQLLEQMAHRALIDAAWQPTPEV